MRSAFILFFTLFSATPANAINNTLTDTCLQLAAAQRCQPFIKLLTAADRQQFPLLAETLQQAERYQLQIIYTQVQRTGGLPKLNYYLFNVDADRYFYPASTVKLVVAALALQWLNQQQDPSLSAATAMLTDSVRPLQTAAWQDDTTANQLPNIAQYIRKILLVSDNDGYNRLYELLGQEYINSELKRLGLQHTVINHRLSVPLPDEENRHFNPVRFIAKDERLLKSVPARSIEQSYRNDDQPTLAAAYYAAGELIRQPMDFTYKNRHSLIDYDGVIKRLVMPELFASTQQFTITAEQRAFLLKYMAMLPRQSQSPRYDENDYPDSYGKFVLYGGDKSRIPDHIKHHNKSGWAYGHILDGVYLQDLQHDLEFFVTAVIYANDNATLNDDTYEIEQLSLPFMQQLGQFIHQLSLRQR